MNTNEVLSAAKKSGVAHNGGAGGQYLLCATEPQLLAFAQALAAPTGEVRPAPLPAEPHGELHPELAKATARTALKFLQAFEGPGIDWQNDQPWPHRTDLAHALDHLQELSAMVLNLADRPLAAIQPSADRLDATESGTAAIYRSRKGAMVRDVRDTYIELLEAALATPHEAETQPSAEVSK